MRHRHPDMLNFQSSEPAIRLSPTDAPRQDGVGELVDAVLAFLLRRYLVILFPLLMGRVAGAIFLVVRLPTYTAQAKIVAGTERPQFVQQHSLLADSPLDQ